MDTKADILAVPTKRPTVRNYDSYFDYEMDLGKDVVAGFLRNADLSLDNKSVLDIGCGEGGILAGLAETYKFRGLGIDYDGGMISKARQVPGSVFRQGEFFAYDFDEKYDFILLRDVLEHCGNPREMLRKISTLCTLTDSSISPILLICHLSVVTSITEAAFFLMCLLYMYCRSLSFLH